MKCVETQELLYDFLTHMLDKHINKEVEAHINSCPKCHKEMDDLQKKLALIDRWNIPEVPEGFEEQVWGKIEKQLQTPVEEKLKAATLVISLKFIHKQLCWRMIHHNGTLISQSVLAAGFPKIKKGLQEVEILEKKLPECFVRVYIYGDTEGIGYLYLKVKNPLGSDPIPQIHLILKDGKDKRISSKLNQDSTASFEGLRQGKYLIEIIKDERIIGNISVDLVISS